MCNCRYLSKFVGITVILNFENWKLNFRMMLELNSKRMVCLLRDF